MNDNKETVREKTGRVKSWVVAVATLLAVVVFIGGLWTVIYYATQGSSDAFDYKSANLSKYVTISRSDYLGYEVVVDVKNNVEMELQHKIMRALASAKGSMMYNGNYVKTVPIAAGDKAYMWYEAYELDENGNKTYFADLCNYGDSECDMVIIGQGVLGSTFYLNDAVGFELGLIGVVPSETGKFVRVERGAFTETDVVYCTATYELESGETFTDARIVLDLSDPELESKWGYGIADHFLEKPDNMGIGITDFDTTFYRTGSGEAVIFTQLRADYVTRSEGTPVTLTVDFKGDYKDKTLAGKTVYFDVYIEKTSCYERAVWSDAIVTDTLHYTLEQLAAYEGDTLTEKYESMLRKALTEEYLETYEQVVEDAIWEHLRSVAKFKKLPESEVSRVYGNYVYALEYSYSTTTGYYESFDLYARDQYGLEEHEDWQAYLMNMVENEVKEKLIFYTILQQEDLLPTDEEYELIYRTELENDFLYDCKMNTGSKYYGKTRSDFESKEAFDSAVSAFEVELYEYVTRGEYRDAVFYNYASSKIVKMANVTNRADS